MLSHNTKMMDAIIFRNDLKRAGWVLLGFEVRQKTSTEYVFRIYGRSGHHLTLEDNHKYHRIINVIRKELYALLTEGLKPLEDEE